MWAKSRSPPLFLIPGHDWGPIHVSDGMGSHGNTEWAPQQQTLISLSSGAGVQGRVQADSCPGCGGSLLVSSCGRARPGMSVPLAAPIPSDSDPSLMASLRLFLRFY